MTVLLCLTSLICAQDPAEPQPVPPSPTVRRRSAGWSSQDPAEPQPVPPSPPSVAQSQDQNCDGKCHENQICAAFARQCGQCKTRVTPCGPHAPICETCAAKKKVCPFCEKSTGGAGVEPDIDRIQRELSKVLPGHRVGRELPNKLAARLLPRVKFFMVFHSGHPCETCAPDSEPMAAVEFRNDKDRKGTVSILRTENELAELLKRQKLAGGAEAALCAAQLVQALWRPEHGGLEPSDVEGVKVDGSSGIAAFEYKKSHALWALRVRLNKDGAFADLHVEDTGLRCK